MVVPDGLKVVRRGKNVEGTGYRRCSTNVNREEINWNIGYSDGKI
jgi:hypothetical protein